MRRDHEANLNTALDQLFLQGSTAILWQHLYLWYNVERLTKSVYRDIIERWQAICEGYGYAEEEIPDLEELHYDGSYGLLLCRGLFEGESRTPLNNRT